MKHDQRWYQRWILWNNKQYLVAPIILILISVIASDPVSRARSQRCVFLFSLLLCGIFLFERWAYAKVLKSKDDQIESLQTELENGGQK